MLTPPVIILNESRNFLIKNFGKGTYIVSLPKIESIQKSRIVIGDKYIPIGENYKEGFYKIVEDYNI